MLLFDMDGTLTDSMGVWNQLAEVQAKHTISVHLTDGYDAAVVERCKAAAKEKALVSKAS